MTALVDTNVLLDVLLKRDPFYDASAAVWSRVASRRARGTISAISMNNVYYLTRKASGVAAALQAVRVLRDTFELVPLDLQIIDAAVASGMADFEDAIQYVSALRAGAHCVVTRNTGDFPSSGVPAVTPEQWLAALDAAAQASE